MTAPRPGADVPKSELYYHARVDPHRRGSSISNIILGGQDGLVNVLGLLLGAAGAGASGRIVLAAGLAGGLAESVSMAAVAYTSTIAQADVYRSERSREYRHIARVPALEREEVRALYEKKGFSGELLARIVQTITADPDVWVAVMMAEEHQLAAVTRPQALRSAAVVGVASLVGCLIPIFPFLFMQALGAGAVSVSIAAVALFVGGVFKARLTVGRPLRTGLEMVGIGLTSAFVGWGIGLLFGVR